MEELFEELEIKPIKCNDMHGIVLIVLDGKTTSPRQIRELKKGLNDKGISFNLSVKGSGDK